MAASDDVNRLQEFVSSAKARGVDDAAITTVLRYEGWSDRKIQGALVAYYRAVLGFDIPLRGGRAESAREAFFYLLSFAMLGVWAIALVWLGDLLIDRSFPSRLDAFSYYSRQGVAGQMASLIVAYPIYLWINRLLGREIAQRPEALDSGVRKWLTYIALVLTAGTLVGDAVWFLTTFLTGDITARFVLKTVLLLLIAGGIFWYYLRTVRGDMLPAQFNRAFGIAATIGVLVAIIMGFTGIGSPAHQRDVSADEQRVQNLGAIASAIYSRNLRGKKPLPASLQEIGMTWQSARDPITNEPYGYERLRGGHYRLCATFSTDNRTDPLTNPWKHGVGRSCFDLDTSSVLPQSGF